MAQTESRLPADGSRRSRNRLSITGICSVSFLMRPNLRPNKRMVVKGKFPYADLCPFPARPMTADLWDNSPLPGRGTYPTELPTTLYGPFLDLWKFETLRRWQGAAAASTKPMPTPSTTMSGRIFSQKPGIRDSIYQESFKGSESVFANEAFEVRPGS